MPKRRPNILFIITDQQYAGAMSCAGNPDVSTPQYGPPRRNGGAIHPRLLHSSLMRPPARQLYDRSFPPSKWRDQQQHTNQPRIQRPDARQTSSPTRGMTAPCRENGTSPAPRPKKAASKSSAVVATTRCRCAPSNSCSAPATIPSSSSRHSSIPTTSAKSPAISLCRKAQCRNRPL